jgi:ATPase subunit of ABC transporter with duplicated ATPase domains
MNLLIIYIYTIYSVWLENWLSSNFEGIAIIVSHDQYFLNSVCTDVLELRSTLAGQSKTSLGVSISFISSSSPPPPPPSISSSSPLPSLSSSSDHYHGDNNTFQNTCGWIYVYIHVQTFINTHTYSYTYIFTYIYMYIYISDHYHGDYNTFQNTCAEKKVVQNRARLIYEKEKDKLKEFVSREGKKYDNPAHQSQRKMKLKQLEALIEVEAVEEDRCVYIYEYKYVYVHI